MAQVTIQGSRTRAAAARGNRLLPADLLDHMKRTQRLTLHLFISKPQLLITGSAKQLLGRDSEATVSKCARTVARLTQISSYTLKRHSYQERFVAHFMIPEANGCAPSEADWQTVGFLGLQELGDLYFVVTFVLGDEVLRTSFIENTR